MLTPKDAFKGSNTIRELITSNKFINESDIESPRSGLHDIGIVVQFVAIPSLSANA